MSPSGESDEHLRSLAALAGGDPAHHRDPHRDFGECPGSVEPGALRQHVREESESIKRVVEEPVEEELRALRRIVDPYLARLRTAVEVNPAFRLIECGVFFRMRNRVAFGVECERADGTLRDLRLSLRCSGGLPGKDYPGTLDARVMWDRPPGPGAA